ncbi:MAG: hypothetical protein IJ357_05575 [Oscillospiraceae bacterium]|nr:hypothetical protein [Oscillospiraceae bacterium]
MAVLGFAGKEKADAWKKRAENLNARTEETLKLVGTCLEGVQEDGKGSPIDNLVAAGTQVIDSTATLVSGLCNLVTTVDEIVASILDSLGVVGDIIGAAAGTIGRLGQ